MRRAVDDLIACVPRFATATLAAVATAAVVVATTTSSAFAATVVVVATADATLIEEPAGALANGAGTSTFAGRTGNNAGSTLRRTLVKFDLAGKLPPGATIQSVTMQLTLARSRFAGDLPASLHRVLAPWSEGPAASTLGIGVPSVAGDVTWIHRTKPGVAWTTPGGDFSASASATTTVGSVLGPYTWPSTPQLVADVAQWLADPATNHGWALLVFEGGATSAKGFATRESAVAADRPTLTIQYEAPMVEVPLPLWSVLLLGLAIAGPRLWRHRRGTLPSIIATGIAATLAVVGASDATAADRDEAVQGDLSGDRFAPTSFTLTWGSGGQNGLFGNNILTGRTGRSALGVVDRDYVLLEVPVGYVLSELRVGTQTTVGGGGSFIGLAAGPVVTTDPEGASASGLLGWKLYGTADRGTDILDDMAAAGNGASGFTGPLDAGSYTLWIQELATGDFAYRFNLVLAPVPEPATIASLVAGLAAAAWRSRRGRRRDEARA